MARPTDYTPELVEKAKAVIEEWEVTNMLPQIAGLAIRLDVSRDTLYEWAKLYPEFSDILEKVMSYQEWTLIQKGLDGKYNSTITKLMLSKHGYRESSDITTNGKALPTPILGAATKDVQEDSSSI